MTDDLIVVQGQVGFGILNLGVQKKLDFINKMNGLQGNLCTL